MINGKTKLFAIIGNPVSHSLSPAMHNAAFAELGMNCAYVPITATNIKETVAGLRHLGFGGASVTVPFKEEVIPWIEDVDPKAVTIGAVNTLVFDHESQGVPARCRGYNTDWIGSNRALYQAIDLHGATALVLGAGGAAKAVAYGLVHSGTVVTLANRTMEKAVTLASELQCAAISFDQLPTHSADILINTTTVGMSPHSDRSPIPAELLPHFRVVMDIVYAPLETRLLREAKSSGCKVIDGLDMLLYQGAEQFSLWTGTEAPVTVMRKALERALDIH